MMSAALGTVRGLTEPEVMRKFAYEEVIASGWNNIIQVGMALAAMRDQELYREEFLTFQDYCLVNWQYGRRYVDYLISAVQVLTNLSTSSSQIRPEHETQLRPLIGLTPEQAVQAWERAAAKAGARKVTEKLVRQAMNELQLAPPPRPLSLKTRSARAEHRRIINGAIGELLLLLSQKADHLLLTEKVETLHSHIQALFGKPAETTA